MLQLKRRLLLLCSLALILIAVFAVNAVVGGALNRFGIQPRDASAWFHIVLAPFVHSEWWHLFYNLTGLLMLSLISLRHSVREYLMASVFIIVVSGALVWLFARPAIHIGASGWIFGLWAWQIALALFARSFVNVMVALLVVFAYGGLVYGLLPNHPGVSFEAHIAGAIAGGLFAFLSSLSRGKPETKIE